MDTLIVSIEKNIRENHVNFIEKTDRLTLLSGFAGSALFYGYIYKKYRNPSYLVEASRLINLCVDEVSEVAYD